jgi:hypothetical protein
VYGEEMHFGLVQAGGWARLARMMGLVMLVVVSLRSSLSSASAPLCAVRVLGSSLHLEHGASEGNLPVAQRIRLVDDNCSLYSFTVQLDRWASTFLPCALRSCLSMEYSTDM